MAEIIIGVIITIISVLCLLWKFLSSNGYADGIEPVEDHGLYTIEFYPLTAAYFPKYKDKYLSVDLEEEDFIPLVSRVSTIHRVEFPYSSMDDAKKVINLHKEQNTKNGVQLIRVD